MPFTQRLQIVGATPAEIVSIQANYDAASVNVQDGLNSLAEAIANPDLMVMLTAFRAGTSITAGIPGVVVNGRPVGSKR